MPKGDVVAIKQAAVGRWPEILSALGGVSLDLLDGKHHPCPKCGGKDRFRLIDAEAGAVYCNQCFTTGNGDGLAAIQWLRGWDFKTAAEEVERFLGGGMPSPRTAARTKSVAATTSKSATKKPTAGKSDRQTFRDAEAAVKALERQLGKCSARWVYHDEADEPVGAVVRWDTPTGKTIRPVARQNDGHWFIGAIPEPRPLYDLPCLGDADWLCVCEGEKACDSVASLGLTATTSSGGAKAADKTDWSPLAGREVIILPDHDEPGAAYANEVAGILHALKPPARVKIVELPGLAEAEDAYDFIVARRADGVDDAAIREEIESLADVAEWWRPPETPEPGPVLTCLADVAPRPISWLWKGRIPLGRIALLVGVPGCGKSFMTADMAARISTGTAWPDGASCPSGSVILLSAEDDAGDTIRPRLDAHGADVRRVFLLSAVRRADEKDGLSERLISLADVDAIKEALAGLPDCKLIVVDPIGSFLGGRVDSHRDNEVRSVLAPIAALAEKHGVAVLLVAHRRKSRDDTAADDTALGSRAFTGIARAVWHLSRDAKDPARRLLLSGKSNLAPEGSGLAFTIGGDPARLCWESSPVEMTADEALADEAEIRKAGRNGGDAVETARDWLASALADGPRPANDVIDEWTNGFGGSKRTLDRGRQVLGVVSYRPAIPGPWWWRLSDEGETNIANEPQGENFGNVGNLAENTAF